MFQSAAMDRVIASLVLTLIVFVQTIKSDILVQSQSTNQVIEELHAFPSLFGKTIPIDGFRGLAVYSNPASGCSDISPPPNTNITNPKWIVVIARGDCFFEQKVRNAQKAGYGAVIVHNVGSELLVQMPALNDDGIEIPSTFVNESAGRIIKENYLFDDGFILLVKPLAFDISKYGNDSEGLYDKEGNLLLSGSLSLSSLRSERMWYLLILFWFYVYYM